MHELIRAYPGMNPEVQGEAIACSRFSLESLCFLMASDLRVLYLASSVEVFAGPETNNQSCSSLKGGGRTT